MKELKVTHRVLAEVLAETFDQDGHFVNAKSLLRRLFERLQQARATPEMQSLIDEMAKEGMNAIWLKQEDLAREMSQGFGDPPLLYFYGHPAFGQIEPRGSDDD